MGSRTDAGNSLISFIYNIKEPAAHTPPKKHIKNFFIIIIFKKNFNCTR